MSTPFSDHRPWPKQASGEVLAQVGSQVVEKGILHLCLCGVLMDTLLSVALNQAKEWVEDAFICHLAAAQHLGERARYL